MQGGQELGYASECLHSCGIAVATCLNVPSMSELMHTLDMIAEVGYAPASILHLSLSFAVIGSAIALLMKIGAILELSHFYGTNLEPEFILKVLLWFDAVAEYIDTVGFWVCSLSLIAVLFVSASFRKGLFHENQSGGEETEVLVGCAMAE